MAVLFALASLALVATHGDASACGGLFCNARPPDPFAPLPVAQNGENVVFSITKDPAGGAPTLQAHIQILYTGDAAKFSWVVPVDAAPTLSTGNGPAVRAAGERHRAALHDQSGDSTGTAFRSRSPLAPAAHSVGTGTRRRRAPPAAPARRRRRRRQWSASRARSARSTRRSIKSDDPTMLKTWLTDNGYIISDQAAALIDVYVRENKYFVALKLLNGVGVKSIQPIVLTFRGTEACVPLRLTAIAANPDMPVLVWVLSDKRVAPRGYYEIMIDEARIDWLRSGTNYFGPTGLVEHGRQRGGRQRVRDRVRGPVVGRAADGLRQNGTINLTTLHDVDDAADVRAAGDLDGPFERSADAAVARRSTSRCPTP